MKTSQARQKKKTFRIYQQGLWDGTRHPCEHFSNYDDSNVDGGHHHHHLLSPSIASVPYTRKIRPLSMTSLVLSSRAEWFLFVSAPNLFLRIWLRQGSPWKSQQINRDDKGGSCKSSWIMPLYYSPWGSYICVPAYWFRVIVALEMKKENVDGPFPTSIVLNSPSIAPLLGHPTPTDDDEEGSKGNKQTHHKDDRNRSQ